MEINQEYIDEKIIELAKLIKFLQKNKDDEKFIYKSKQENIDNKINELRNLYKYHSKFFTRDDIEIIKNHINNYKKVINYIENNKNKIKFNYIDSKKNKLKYNHNIDPNLDINKLPRGTVVSHIKENYLGVIDNYTKMKALFEDSSDLKEYRVYISSKKIMIASPKNLKVEGSSYFRHCFRCRGFVNIFSVKCSSCGWYKCSKCGSCRCNWHFF